MAKTSLTGSSIRPVVRDAAGEKGWSLCIGAGTSKGVFPDWYELVARLVEKKIGLTDAKGATTDLAARFGLDALIRAAQDQFEQSDEDFTSTLAEVLYSSFQTTAGRDWPAVAKALNAIHPGAIGLDYWKALHGVVTRNYSNTSVVSLAPVLARAIQGEAGPQTILSFNAEPLLYALINAEVALAYKPPATAKPGIEYAPLKPMDRVVGTTSHRAAGRPSFCFCHGLLPIPGLVRSAGGGKRESTLGESRLVFSESQYLQIASTMFSWQSAVFLQTALNRPIVFVGVSLSDPNMRRWLSWAHDTRGEEIALLTGTRPVSTTHFWINKRPTSEHVAGWTESAVAHLGVRVIWITDWSELPTTLEKMIGL